MKSMTGYGKGVATANGRTVTIELKSVNNRFLEINSRLPRAFGAVDDVIRKQLGAELARGSVDVYFNYENKSESAKTVVVDEVLAAEYVKAAKKLRTQFCLEDDFQTTALLRAPEVTTVAVGEDDLEAVKELSLAALRQAIDGLNLMRETEGKTVLADLKRLAGSIADALGQVVVRAPKVVEEYRNKLKTRMEDVLAGVEIDQARLLNEVAFFTDKADINEEISRLKSHLGQFAECLASNEPQGRKLDFISQEMNREINTMGSKSNDLTLTTLVVRMKNDLEKIKEQIRNVE